MLNARDVTRRKFIGSAATVAAAAGMGIAHAETTERIATSPAAAKGLGTMSDYSHVRGFNYQPSYGSHGLETWGDAFDAVFKKELLLGRQYFPEMNTIRLWLSYDAFIRQPDEMPKRFHHVIDLSEELVDRFQNDVAISFPLWYRWFEPQREGRGCRLNV